MIPVKDGGTGVGQTTAHSQPAALPLAADPTDADPAEPSCAQGTAVAAEPAGSGARLLAIAPVAAVRLIGD